MAARPVPLILSFCALLSFLSICTSGAFVDFTYDDATEGLLITEHHHVYLFLKPVQGSNCTERDLATSWIKQVLVPNLHMNISSIIVAFTGTETQLPSLCSVLDTLHASLRAVGVERRIRVSPAIALASLKAMARNRSRHWLRAVELVKSSGSFVLVDAGAGGELAGASLAQKAVAAIARLPPTGTDVVLRLASSAAPSAAATARLSAATEECLHGHAMLRETFLGLLVHVSSPRRALVAGNGGTEAEANATVVAHDMFAPVTNPTTTPPVTNTASPGIVTVPATNPGGAYPDSPTTIPPLNPEPTPVTMPAPVYTPVPAMNPAMPSPVTMPAPVYTPVPGMNPAMPSPVTTPVVPVTNPATTYPYQQQGGAPVVAPPATAVPGASGQTWCVAKAGVMEMALQNGLDYACGVGGVDCSAIQPMASCYNPNTMQAHASYAFNSYFQRNPTPASCDFGGAGMLVSTNPSLGTCMYQTSGVSAGYSPAAAAGTGYAPGGGSGSTVLNNPGGSTAYGSDSPVGGTASSSCAVSCGWALWSFIWLLTFAYIRDTVQTQCFF